jgi:hypothetical protein
LLLGAFITISPLVCPLHLFIVVLSGRQSHHYQQWYCRHCHGRYVVASIIVVMVAARDSGSSSSSLNQQSTPCTTIAATNHNDHNLAMAVFAEESTFFLPPLS